MTLVSIACPVRNCEQTVALAVSSILNQTFQDWELLIIDDGSTDGTLAQVRRFCDKRLRIFHDGKAKGLPARLNQAMNDAAGRYFARMDGDDVSYPKRLEMQLEFLRLHPDVDVVGGGVMVFENEQTISGLRFGPDDHDTICRRPYVGFPMAHPTYFGKADWFRRHRYRETAVRCEDQDLLLRAFRSSRYANVPAVVLGYREQLDLKKILIGRRFFARMVMAEYVRNGQMLVGLKGVLWQCLKGMVDTVALWSHLDYTLLRHRIGPFTKEDAAEWFQVLKNCNAISAGVRNHSD